MAALSSKSAQEISWMLDDYGIKHGPVVDSTRALYEKKLREVMAKGKKTKPPSDRTYYREEEEEVTYIHHHKPFNHNVFADRRNPISRYEYRDLDTADGPVVYRTQASYRSIPPARKGAYTYETQREPAVKPRSERMVPLWLQILLFLIVVCVLVFIFINLESVETAPFKSLT